MPKKTLSEAEILSILFDPENSEDELENFSDDEVVEKPIQLNEEDLEKILGDSNIMELVEDVENIDPNQSLLDLDQPSTSQNAPSISKNDFKSIIWKKRKLCLTQEQTKFHGQADLPKNLEDLETPYQLFKYFFDDEILNKIVVETNLYCRQKNIDDPFVVTKVDINQFLGILIMSSIINYPNIRMFWDSLIGVKLISDTMSQRKFEKIRSIFHLNNNDSFIIDTESPKYDKLHKIRPLVDHLNVKFSSIPLEEHLSVDEQICASKANHHLKQYMPAKPHKWGYKLFILSGVSGFAYRFEIYTGLENSKGKRLQNEPDLGASGNVVVRLLRNVPKGCNYKVYFDNYYTSIHLVTFLAKQGNIKFLNKLIVLFLVLHVNLYYRYTFYRNC